MMHSMDLEYIARETQLPFAGDDDAPHGRPVTATLEELRYAEHLRLQLRETYRRKPVPPPTLWCVGID